MKAKKITLKENTVLCREGDLEKDIYLVISGRLLICSRSGKRVTPIAYIGENEYFGEMSFLDNKPRSADVVAIESTELLQIPPEALKEQLPKWLLFTMRQMTQRIRSMDEVIRDRGIKRQNVDTIKPLSIDEQRVLFDIIDQG
ncbi:MAG: hypothetical protein CME65_13930 [Halobacteriovoraceae bacterium]|nr:hypothetical protein [Halobacteriovoraceae bacterium]|tara:strand:+ start:1422 stop:1850 length:429 start_codon:yes stop_codon:yes gene_type:complete